MTSTCSAARALAALLLFPASSACSGGRTNGATADDEAPPPGVSIVSSSVVVDRCPEAAKMSAKQAQLAIRKLVEPCSKVPGGAAHFSATLLPGGRIELASPSGDPADGVVPTCVLEHQLVHRVKLSQSCKFDVVLEARGATP